MCSLVGGGGRGKAKVNKGRAASQPESESASQRVSHALELGKGESRPRLWVAGAVRGEGNALMDGVGEVCVRDRKGKTERGSDAAHP